MNSTTIEKRIDILASSEKGEPVCRLERQMGSGQDNQIVATQRPHRRSSLPSIPHGVSYEVLLT